jgi:arylformamidase
MVTPMETWAKGDAVQAIDFEAEYNNRTRVPDHGEVMARWAVASQAARTGLKADLDIPYGPGARHRYDLYHGVNSRRATDGIAPLAVYIHGGYWQRGDRADYAFAARELVAQGVSVAMPSYTLAPAATVADIVLEMRMFLASLWARAEQRPVVVGHSAGGHLAAAAMAGGGGAAGVPDDLVRAAYSISGVFDLGPLVGTSLNGALGLTAATAKAASPQFWAAPAKACRFVSAVGGLESREFLRQSLDIVGAWSAAGVKAECVIVPGANHFTIVDELARADSMMVARIGELARSVAG